MRTRAALVGAATLVAVGAFWMRAPEPAAASGQFPEPEDALQLAEDAVDGDLETTAALEASAQLAGYASNAELESEEDPTPADDIGVRFSTQ